MGVQPSDLAVSATFDPPVDQVDRAAFAARALAGDLYEQLSGRGLACTRVVVEAETEHGERLARRWRDEGVLGPGAVADRVRWQLEGWLHGPPAVRPSAGIVKLGLVPDEVVPATGRQPGFWGGPRQPMSGQPGPAPGWRACWVLDRCGCRCGGEVGTQRTA